MMVMVLGVVALLIVSVVVTVLMAASVSAMAYSVIGWKALWLFLLAMAVLALFLQDFIQAQNKGKAHADGAS